MNTTKMLSAVLVLQIITLAGQWLGQPGLSAARAEVSDPGARQLAMVDELKTLNGKMDRLIGLLESGKLQVVAAKSDEAKGAPAK